MPVEVIQSTFPDNQLFVDQLIERLNKHLTEASNAINQIVINYLYELYQRIHPKSVSKKSFTFKYMYVDPIFIPIFTCNKNIFLPSSIDLASSINDKIFHNSISSLLNQYNLISDLLDPFIITFKSTKDETLNLISSALDTRKLLIQENHAGGKFFIKNMNEKLNKARIIQRKFDDLRLLHNRVADFKSKLNILMQKFPKFAFYQLALENQFEKQLIRSIEEGCGIGLQNWIIPDIISQIEGSFNNKSLFHFSGSNENGNIIFEYFKQYRIQEKAINKILQGFDEYLKRSEKDQDTEGKLQFSNSAITTAESKTILVKSWKNILNNESQTFSKRLECLEQDIQINKKKIHDHKNPLLKLIDGIMSTLSKVKLSKTQTKRNSEYIEQISTYSAKSKKPHFWYSEGKKLDENVNAILKATEATIAAPAA